MFDLCNFFQEILDTWHADIYGVVFKYMIYLISGSRAVMMTNTNIRLTHSQRSGRRRQGILHRTRSDTRSDLTLSFTLLPRHPLPLLPVSTE